MSPQSVTNTATSGILLKCVLDQVWSTSCEWFRTQEDLAPSTPCPCPHHHFPSHLLLHISLPTLLLPSWSFAIHGTQKARSCLGNMALAIPYAWSTIHHLDSCHASPVPFLPSWWTCPLLGRDFPNDPFTRHRYPALTFSSQHPIHLLDWFVSVALSTSLTIYFLYHLFLHVRKIFRIEMFANFAQRGIPVPRPYLAQGKKSRSFAEWIKTWVSQRRKIYRGMHMQIPWRYNVTSISRQAQI